MTAAESQRQSDLIETRQRLLDAAGEVFAEHGFQGASVREICQRADANIAAVNYHFGDKQALYGEVLRYAHHCAAVDVNEMRAMFENPAPPEEKLRLFVHNFLMRMLDAGRPAWHGKLIAQEMVTPTAALDELVRDEIQPKFFVLRTIVAGVANLPLEHEAVRWYAASVIAQCLFWHNNRAVIERLYPDLKHDYQSIEFLAEHVTRFSLSGLRGAMGDLNPYERRAHQ